VERRVDRAEGTAQEERVSVGRRTYNRLGADIAAATRAIFNDELLTQPLRQPLPDEPRSNVARAGWSERHDQVHPPRWIGLPPSVARDGRQRGSAGGQMQKISAGKFRCCTLSFEANSVALKGACARPRSRIQSVHKNCRPLLVGGPLL